MVSQADGETVEQREDGMGEGRRCVRKGNRMASGAGDLLQMLSPSSPPNTLLAFLQFVPAKALVHIRGDPLASWRLMGR